jgi:hypothetical protein
MAATRHAAGRACSGTSAARGRCIGAADCHWGVARAPAKCCTPVRSRRIGPAGRPYMSRKSRRPTFAAACIAQSAFRVRNCPVSVKAPDVSASVIYVKELKARVVDADIIYVYKMKVEKGTWRRHHDD